VLTNLTPATTREDGPLARNSLWVKARPKRCPPATAKRSGRTDQ
jgi:hypothetical protein